MQTLLVSFLAGDAGSRGPLVSPAESDDPGADVSVAKNIGGPLVTKFASTARSLMPKHPGVTQQSGDEKGRSRHQEKIRQGRL